jgi:NIF3 (NGG1p interacting factor 3)
VGQRESISVNASMFHHIRLAGRLVSWYVLASHLPRPLIKSLESPVVRPNANQVLLTIEWVLNHSGLGCAPTYRIYSLTTAVCEEALSTPTAAIITYHPTLFKPLTSLTLSK